MYKCKQCDRLFKYQSDFYRHKNRKTPCQKKSVKHDQNFQCTKCNKIYSSKSNLTRHKNNYCTSKSTENKKVTRVLNKKNNHKKCTELRQNSRYESNNAPECTKINENAPIINDDKTFKCNYCQEIFTRNSSLKRHLKSRCKIKIENERQKEEIFQRLLDQMNKMEDAQNEMQNEIKELKTENARLMTTGLGNTTNNTNITNNNNTINNNQILNINLVAFGKEDKEQLSNMELFKIIKKGFKSVPEFVKVLHFDENKPENHNIFIPNMRDGYIMIFDGEKWHLVDRTDTIENLFDDGRNFLVDKKDEINELLSDKNRKILVKFDRFNRDIDSCPSKKSEILNDIKLILYNNRDIPMKTKKSLVMN